MGSGPSLADLVKKRATALEAFEAWERRHAPTRPAAAIIADLSALYDRLPREVRRRVDDPERKGVRRMHAALAVLGGGPRP